MTFEGVGETSSLADALSPLEVCLDIRHSACALRFNTSYLEADLRRLSQSLQKLGQVVLFSIFASGLHFLLLASARFLPLARGELACARLFLDLNFLVWRARLLLRSGGRDNLRHRRRDRSDGEGGSKHNFVQAFTSALLKKTWALSAGERP